MNVVQEKVNKLNAILKVEIKSEDYQSKVKSTLEKYRKTAKVPGFRPGHVPFGMIQKQYGKLTPKTVIDKDDEVTGVFFNDSEGIESTATFTLDKLKGKSNLKSFTTAKIGDVLTLKTKGLFQESQDLMTYLKLDNETVNGLDVQVTFTISEINSREKAELDQELFDKLFGPGNIKTVTELRAKITEDAEKQFEPHDDRVSRCHLALKSGNRQIE